jgi:hypothetical protein
MQQGYDFFGSLEPEEERQRHRVFKLSTGSKIHFRKTIAKTTWGIAFDKGTVPKVLSGKYLSFSRAFAAAQKYFAEHPQRKIQILEEDNGS